MDITSHVAHLNNKDSNQDSTEPRHKSIQNAKRNHQIIERKFYNSTYI